MIAEQLSGIAARANLAMTYGPRILLAEGEGSTGIDVKGIVEGATSGDGGETFTEFNEKLETVGGGTYHIMSKIGVYLALFAIVLVAIGLMFANTNERQEKKSKLIWVIVGCVVMLGAGAILIFIGQFSNGLFGE